MSHRPQGRTHAPAGGDGGGEASIHFVTNETRDVYDADQAESIRELCRAFETAVDPLDGERTTSRMHGQMWELRRQASSRHQPDWSFGLGAPFARELARIGGSGAKGLLFSLGAQAPGRLRELCHELATGLPAPMPSWAAELPDAQLVRSAASSARELVQLVVLEFRRRHHPPFAITAMINDAKGGIVRHYGLIGPLETIVEIGDPDDAFYAAGKRFRPLPADEACRRVRTAIEAADAAPARLIDLESAKAYRALTLGRIEPHLAAPERFSRPAA